MTFLSTIAAWKRFIVLIFTSPTDVLFYSRDTVQNLQLEPNASSHGRDNAEILEICSYSNKVHKKHRDRYSRRRNVTMLEIYSYQKQESTQKLLP